MQYSPIASKRDYLRRNECDGNSAVSGENQIYIKKGCRKTHGPGPATRYLRTWDERAVATATPEWRHAPGPLFSEAIQADRSFGCFGRINDTASSIFSRKNHPCPVGREARFVATVGRHRRDGARRSWNSSAFVLITDIGVRSQCEINNNN